MVKDVLNSTETIGNQSGRYNIKENVYENQNF